MGFVFCVTSSVGSTRCIAPVWQIVMDVCGRVSDSCTRGDLKTSTLWGAICAQGIVCLAGRCVFTGHEHMGRLCHNQMDGLFYNKASFNSDISPWNVAKVTTFVQTFRGASAFNQPIG